MGMGMGMSMSMGMWHVTCMGVGRASRERASAPAMVWAPNRKGQRGEGLGTEQKGAERLSAPAPMVCVARAENVLTNSVGCEIMRVDPLCKLVLMLEQHLRGVGTMTADFASMGACVSSMRHLPH